MSGEPPSFESHPAWAIPTPPDAPAQVVAVAAPADPLSADVARLLEQPPPERSWVQSAMLLGITLILFASAGFFSSSLTDLALLVAVLLFHESGHYLGMRLFNYQDVRMFFIPFFGAAVSGRSTSVEGYKEAIVLLLGPLPGILLGIVLGAICVYHDLPALRTAAMMLLAINGFNLLPLMPLDGGRLVHLIIFSRQRHVEAIFRLVTAILLGLCAFALQAWLLGIVAFFLLLGIQLSYYVSKLAQELRPAAGAAAINLADRIPPDWATLLIERVRATFPSMKQPKSLAHIVRQVWQQMHLQPPGLAASVVLLTVYAAAFFGTPIVAVWFHAPRTSVVAHSRVDGGIGPREEVRSWGRLQYATELGADGAADGRYTEYFPDTGRVKVEGSYADELRDGVWTYYTQDGQVELREEYREDELISPATSGASQATEP